MNDQPILTIPRHNIRSQFLPSGMLPRVLGPELGKTICDPSRVVFIPRDKAETDDGFLQLIPYVVLWRDRKILSYVRTKESDEERLHQKKSIGFGGHIGLDDWVGGDNAFLTIYKAALREVWEETGDHTTTLVLDGFLYADSEDVGRVHLGMVYTAPCRPLEELKFGEEVFDPKFELASELVADPTLEEWSSVLAKYYNGLQNLGTNKV